MWNLKGGFSCVPARRAFDLRQHRRLPRPVHRSAAGLCKRCEAEPTATLTLYKNPEVEKLLDKGKKYVSHAKRGDRPSAIAWIVRNHPEIKDSQIVKLLRTTKPTITAIRERTHKNIHNIVPRNPVTLGLCSESDLNAVVQSCQPKTQQ